MNSALGRMLLLGLGVVSAAAWVSGSLRGAGVALWVGAVGAALLALMALNGLLQVGRARRTLGEAMDATNRSHARALDALREEAGTLTAVLDSMAEGIWVTDASGVVLRHNDALKEMLYAGQDLVGQRPLFLVRNSALHEAVLKACAEGESTKLEVVLEGVRPRVVAVRVAPLGHSRTGSVAVFRDVTELRRLERVRQDFVANVSHELRTPITAIRGYAETLKAGALQDSAHAPQMVEIIHRQSERLSELVADLLDLSRLDAGELDLTIAPVLLVEIAWRAGEAVAPRAASKRLTVVHRVDESLVALADWKAVEQVLINLLDNAIKYTPEGGTIELVGERLADRCLLSVRDNGLGIEARHLPRLFERFYRVDRGRSRDMGGTGLGLSIVKHLVGAMNGDVRVDSHPGEGSLFTVSLPAS